MQMLAAGFLLVIVIGGILLWLPVCNQEPIAFTDALFTSTSAVCVTGLMTVVPATQFYASWQGGTACSDTDWRTWCSRSIDIFFLL